MKVWKKVTHICGMNSTDVIVVDMADEFKAVLGDVGAVPMSMKMEATRESAPRIAANLAAAHGLGLTVVNGKTGIVSELSHGDVYGLLESF